MAAGTALTRCQQRVRRQGALEVSNPLDFSSGFPPTLPVKDTDSLTEQVQRAFPAARVVKSLNAQLPQSSTVFVSGDDAGAKSIVTALVESLGHDDVIDLGDLSSAHLEGARVSR